MNQFDLRQFAPEEYYEFMCTEKNSVYNVSNKFKTKRKLMFSHVFASTAYFSLCRPLVDCFMNSRQSIAEGPIYGALGLTALDTRCGTPTRLRISAVPPSVVRSSIIAVCQNGHSIWPEEWGINLWILQLNMVKRSAFHYQESSTWLSPWL